MTERTTGAQRRDVDQYPRGLPCYTGPAGSEEPRECLRARTGATYGGLIPPYASFADNGILPLPTILSPSDRYKRVRCYAIVRDPGRKIA